MIKRGFEQKNGSVVRRLVGYGRLEGFTAAETLAKLHDAARLYVNFFLPSFKLQTKTREGAKVIRKYDKPATPYERLLSNQTITEVQKQQLREVFAALDPIDLLSRIRAAQREITQIEVSAAGTAQPATADQKLDRFVGNLRTAWKNGEVRPTHRKPLTGPRSWRTRADPFETTWPTIELWLNEQPDATAKDLFQRLREQTDEQFEPGQLRTLQRRVKEWRTKIARRLVLGIEGNSADLLEATEQETEAVFS